MVFLISRIFLTLWAALILTLQPIPVEQDEVLRPYLGETILKEGSAGLLLGPWQRFDTQHYLRIARLGYVAEEDSVFPPLYPALIRGFGYLFQGVQPIAERHLLAGIVISNLAFLGTLIVLFRITEDELDRSSAKRAVVYLAIFPTAFFLTAAYTESLFLFFALAAIWFARQNKFWIAGLFGLLAPLTRLTGWILVVPLAFEYMRQRRYKWRRIKLDFLAVFLPLVGISTFLLWRSISGLPQLAEIYGNYWYQVTAIPGSDLFTALRKMFAGEAPFTLFFDFFIVFLLIAMIIMAFKKLNPTYGIYSTLLLLFILLPASEQKPLYSFSRYALAFFPMFMVFGQVGKNAWINRLILYPSTALYLYFSGQFFMWGWVA